MSLEKIFYTIGTAFLAVFLMSAALVLTNKLNMWMVGLLSLAVAMMAFAGAYAAAKKSQK